MNAQCLAAPLSDRVGGIYARTDMERGVRKAPADEASLASIDGGLIRERP